VNHSSKMRDATFSVTLSVRLISQFTPDGPKAIQLQGSILKIVLHPDDTTIVEWK
jgi:hypothetical protein